MKKEICVGWVEATKPNTQTDDCWGNSRQPNLLLLSVIDRT